MTRALELTRDEAELLVDLLTLTDHYLADELRIELRKQWGMAPQDLQLEAAGMTLAELRRRIKSRLIDEK